MFTKKGQAAMEFLMTYGWAILVVLAAIGALAYFGVLSPDRFLPSKCTVAGGFSCTEYKVDGTAGTVSLRIQNNLGRDIASANVTLDGKGSNSACPATPTKTFSSSVVNGDFINDSLMTWTGCTFSGTKYQGDITVTYIISGQTVSHDASGSIVSAVE